MDSDETDPEFSLEKIYQLLKCAARQSVHKLITTYIDLLLSVIR